MKSDRKIKAEKSLPRTKAVKGTRRVLPKVNGSHPLAAYEHIPVGIVETSLDGKYINVNEEFCRIVGYPRDALLQLGIRDCTHEDDYGIDIKLYEQLITGKIPFYRLEKRFVRKSGGVIWVELTRTLVCDSENNPLYTMGVVLDISDRKDVEKVLRQSVESLRLATETARMFMWEWDFQNYSYILADNFEQVLGFSANLLSKNRFETIGELIPAEDVQAISEAFENAVANQRDLHSVSCRVTNPKTGQLVWLEINAKIVYDHEGKPERMFGVAQNITERKKTQDEIAVISRMPEENPNPVMRLTPNGEVLYANGPSKSMLEAWKQEGDQTIPEELQTCIAEVFASCTKKEIEISQNGKTFSCTLAPIPEAGYINFYGSDISKRKEAELALQRNEANLRNFLENASVGIHWVDKNGIIIWANHAELEMLGYTRDEYFGRSIHEFHVDEPAIKDILKRLKQGETLTDYEVRLRHQDGSIRYGIINSNVLWEGGEFIHTRCFTRDITEHKLAEEKLRESEERFRALVSQATAGIAQSDMESRLVFVNPRFCEMLGYSEEELLGKTIWELTYTQDLEENKRLFKKLITQGESYQFEKRFIRKDGSPLWTSVSVSTIRDLDGNPKGGVGVVLDINERKQAEDALKEFARQQEALYKLSEQLHRAEALEDIYDAALDAILDALQCDRASILIYDHQNVMRFVAWRGLSDAYRKATDGHSPWTPDAKDPQPIRMDDVSTADLSDSLRSMIQGEGIGSLAFIPLVVNEKLIGKFMIYYDHPHTFDEAELDLSLTIAHQLAFGVDRKRADEKIWRLNRELQAQLDEMNSLLEILPTGVWIGNEDSTQIIGNASAYQMLGLPAGMNVSVTHPEPQTPPDMRLFVNEKEVEPENAPMQRVARTGQPMHNFEHEIQFADGTSKTMYASIVPLFDQDGTVRKVIGAYTDITERKQTEKRLALLGEVSEMLRNVDDPYELMYTISRTIGEHLHVKRVLFNEIDLDHDLEIVHRDYHNGLEAVAGVHKVSDYSSATSREVASGKTVVNMDSKTDPRTARDYKKTYAVSGERAYVVVPMMRENRWVASLWVSDDVPRNWTSDEVSLLETIAERTWTVIEKLRINTELRESEERLRATLETTVVGFATLTTDTRFVEVNDAFCHIVGYSREELLGMDCSVLTHPDYQESTRQHVRQLLAGEIPSFVLEKLYIRKNGAQIWVQNSVSVMRGADGKPISLIVLCQDVTGRKRIEEELRIENERFMRFVNSNIVGILIGNADGEVILANDYYLNLLGVSRPDFMDGKVDWKQFTPPEWLPADEKAIQELRERGVCEPYEKEYVRADGTRIPVYIADALLPGPRNEIAAFVLDISERKRAEEALRASEERYRGIVSQTIGGIAETDLNGYYTMVNDRYCEIVGYTRAELLHGMQLQDITHPEDLPKNLELFGQLIAEGTSFELEKRYIRPDGSTVWVHNSVSAIIGRDGKPQAAVAAVIDVTERKRAEQALRESEERYRFIVENTSDGIWWIELTEPMPISLPEEEQIEWYYKHAVIRQCNLGLARMYGYNSAEEVTGLPLRVVMPRENPMNLELLRNFIRSGYRLVDTESREIASDGRDLVFLNNMIGIVEDGKLIGEWGTNRDITERKRSEEALRASEKLYRAIARNIPGGGVYVVDKDFRYLVAEGPVTEAFGLSREMLEGRTVIEVFPDERGKRMEERLQRNFAGETVSFETRFNGRVYWTQQAPLHDSIGHAIILTLDITERKQAEDALRESEARFRNMADHAPVMVWVTDEKGYCTYLSQSWYEFCGQTPETGLGYGWLNAVHPDDRENSGNLFFASIQQRASFQLEYRLQRHDGSYRWAIDSAQPRFSESGEFLGYIGSVIDITERKQMEEALRESEERFRAILRQATAGIVRKDAEGKLTFINEAFCHMLGYTESDLLGKTVWDFMHEEDVAESRELYERLMLEGIPFKLERRLLRADGSVIWVDASVSPILDAEGKPQSAVAVEVDITARKQAEEALRELNLQLENRVQQRTARLNDAIQILRDEIVERRKVEDALRKSEAAARENEEKLSSLFDLLPVGISFLDPQGQIIQMNAALTNILKLSREQLLAQEYQPRKYIRPNGTLMPLTDFASTRALTEEKTIYNVETGIILENSEVIWTSVSAAPVNVADVGAVVVTADVTESKRAERALQESRERLQILSQRLVEVQEEERRAIARELHDRVGQTLAALNINLIIINGQLTGKVDEQVNTRLSDSMKLVAETIALVRDVMSNLRPSVLDDYGLEAALESYLSQYTARYEIETKFEKPEPSIPRLGSSVEMTFLRIAQEALMNIARHAQARQVRLALWQEEDAICMTVQDNGKGIESWQEANRPGSHGLTIMRERAEAFGGSLRVSSIPGQGTKVEVRIPMEMNDPSQDQKEGKQ